MPVSAQDAQAHVASLNQRKRQKLPTALMAMRPPVYVHNIFDMPHQVQLGGLRSWNIPACPKGSDYVSIKVPGMIADEYDTGDGNGSMGVLPVMGEDVANEIVGCKSAQKELGIYTNNKEWLGVFWSHNEVPSEEELETARGKLQRYAEVMVADGNRRNLEGHSDKPGVGINSIGVMHRKFALYLGQNVPWAQLVQQMIDCPGCGDRVKPNIIQHVACGYVFDEDRFDSRMAKPTTKTKK